MIEHLHIAKTGVPIHAQLREQILRAIGSGLVKPGAQLPTMRQVAVALRIDLNTVQRVYAELERDGVLTTTQGCGTFVAEHLPSLDQARIDAAVATHATQAIAAAHAAGLDPAAVAEAILATLSAKSEPSS